MTKKGPVSARTPAVKRRTFSREFKLKVIREVEAGESHAQVAREYQITDNTIAPASAYQDRAFAGRGHACTDEARLHELERMMGRLTLENDFLMSFRSNNRKISAIGVICLAIAIGFGYDFFSKSQRERKTLEAWEATNQTFKVSVIAYAGKRRLWRQSLLCVQISCCRVK